MPPGKSSDTAAEGLKQVLSQVAVLATLPDADPKFFSMLQQAITGFLRQAGVPPTSPQPGGAPGQPQPGMPPGGPPGMPGGAPGMGGPPRPPMMGGGFGGLSATGNLGRPTPGPQAAPNADELRRLLGGGAPG